MTARKTGESFEEYRERRTKEQKETREHLRGKFVVVMPGTSKQPHRSKHYGSQDKYRAKKVNARRAKKRANRHR